MKKRKFFLTAVMAAALIGMILYGAVTQRASASKNSETVKPFSAAPTVVYGLLKDNAVLLSEDFSPITSLPATYFVVINDETTSHYTVTYLDLSGLVEKAQVEKVDYEPKTKFAAAYFTSSNDTHPVNIRSAPTAAASVIAAIPDKTKAFMYGSVAGDALIPAAGSKWHYVRYNDGVNRYGYVYSAQGAADNFAINIIEKVEPPPPEKTDPETSPKDGGSFDWLYILLLCIPAVIIMLALFSRPKKQAE